ncbi:Nedd4 interacting protein [Gryganskiella cystojenkinii]|nr:Nedd4 interacting protein [Gryganskiella cystojenkinii]
MTIPVSEAQEGSTSSSAGSLSAFSRKASSLPGRGGSSSGYARVNAEDALEDHDDDNDANDEGDVMLRPMRRQSRSEITVADDVSPNTSSQQQQPQHQQQLHRSQPTGPAAKAKALLHRFLPSLFPSSRPPHFPVAVGARRVIQTTMDGVFSNLSAKPRVEKPHQEELPPPYKAAALDQSPAYYEALEASPYGDDEFLVDGLPVGGLYGFVWNMIMSMSFQFVGFFLTYLLHTSHATKNGSKMGLGLTFMSMGTQMMSGKAPGADKTDDEDSDTGYMGNTGGQEPIKAVQEYIWLSYFMLFLGSAIMLQSGIEFLRAKRQEMIFNARAVSSSSTSSSTAEPSTEAGSSSGTSSAAIAAGLVAAPQPLTRAEINAIHASAV